MTQHSVRGVAGIDPQILKEAAGWLTQLHDGSLSEAQRMAWQRWKEASPEHARAWDRAEQLLGTINVIPAEFSHTLKRPKPALRRQLLKALGAVVVVGPLSWLGYRGFEEKSGRAYYTGVGESRTLVLPDGTALALNTDSAVKIDYSEQQRRIKLVHGEIFVSTLAAAALDQRPVTVVTDDGWLRLQDCRCNVRRTDGRSDVAVITGSLELALAGNRNGAVVALGAMQHASFTTSRLLDSGKDSVMSPLQTAWMDGVINADAMRLADFIDEVSRYRPGLLVCEPAVADLRISGVFQVADTDKILTAVENTLPVKLVYRTPYWVIVAPRGTPPMRT